MGALHTFPDARAARLADVLRRRHSTLEIADAIEILVDVLDLMSGDPDAEDGDEDRCQAGDDGCAAFMLNGLHYGSEAEYTYPTLPIYGVDQSTGPLNENDAHRRHMEAVWTPGQ